MDEGKLTAIEEQLKKKSYEKFGMNGRDGRAFRRRNSIQPAGNRAAIRELFPEDDQASNFAMAERDNALEFDGELRENEEIELNNLRLDEENEIPEGENREIEGEGLENPENENRDEENLENREEENLENENLEIENNENPEEVSAVIENENENPEGGEEKEAAEEGGEEEAGEEIEENPAALAKKAMDTQGLERQAFAGDMFNRLMNRFEEEKAEGEEIPEGLKPTIKMMMTDMDIEEDAYYEFLKKFVIRNNDELRTMLLTTLNDGMNFDFSVFDDLSDEAILNNWQKTATPLFLISGLSETIVAYRGTPYQFSDDRIDNFNAILEAVSDSVNYIYARLKFLAQGGEGDFEYDMTAIEGSFADRMARHGFVGKDMYDDEKADYVPAETVAPEEKQEEENPEEVHAENKEQGEEEQGEREQENEEPQQEAGGEGEQLAGGNEGGEQPEQEEHAEGVRVVTVQEAAQLYEAIGMMFRRALDLKDRDREEGEAEARVARKAKHEKAYAIVQAGRHSLDSEQEEFKALSYEEILAMDTSALDRVADDDYVLEHIDEIAQVYKLSYWIAHAKDDRFDDKRKVEQIRKLGAMLEDCEDYVVSKVRLMANPYYELVYDERRFGEIKDIRSFYETKNSMNFSDDDADDFVNDLEKVLRNKYMAKVQGGSFSDGYEAYGYNPLSIEEQDRALRDKPIIDAAIETYGDTFTVLKYILTGDEVEVTEEQIRAYLKGISEREVRTEDAKNTWKGEEDALKRAQDIIRLADAKVKADISYLNFDRDERLGSRALIPMLTTGGAGAENEAVVRDLNANAEILMNFGSPNQKVRAAAYKELVDRYLTIDMSQFDNMSDDYIIDNAARLIPICYGAAEIASNNNFVSVCIDNGYLMTPQKYTNLKAITTTLAEYGNYMTTRVQMMMQPEYKLLYVEGNFIIPSTQEEMQARLDEMMQLGKVRIEDESYFKASIEAKKHYVKQEDRQKTFLERAVAHGYVELPGGVYGEDLDEGEAYRLDPDQRESLARREKERLPYETLRVMTGKAPKPEDLARFENGKEDRRRQATLAKALPVAVLNHPIELNDLNATNPEEFLRKFVYMDLKALDHIDDEHIINEFDTYVHYIGLAEAAETALALMDGVIEISEDKKACIENRIKMFADLKSFMLNKIMLMRDPLYVSLYSETLMTEGTDEKSMEGLADRLASAQTRSPDEVLYLSNLAYLKTHTFQQKYTGSGEATAEAYGAKAPGTFLEDRPDAARLLGQGEEIVHRDEEGRQEGAIPGEEIPEERPGEAQPNNGAQKELEEGLPSESMSKPLKMLSEFSKTLGKEENLTKFQSIDLVTDGISEVFELLAQEAPVRDQEAYGQGYGEIVSAFDRLRDCCGTYLSEHAKDRKTQGDGLHSRIWTALTGEKNKASTEEGAVIAMVRYIRLICDYAKTQTELSAKMTQIYLEQAGNTDIRMPWTNIYHYAEQPIVWEQGLVPYHELVIPAPPGEAPARTEIKEFDRRVTSYEKIEHWMKIFHERKPDGITQVNHQVSLKRMNVVMAMVKAVNDKTSDLLPERAEDFLTKAGSIYREQEGCITQLKRILDGLSDTTPDDKDMRKMVENIIECMKGDRALFDRYRSGLIDSYEQLRNMRTTDEYGIMVNQICDVYLAWKFKAIQEDSQRQEQDDQPAHVGNQAEE